jgi:hypothetical protein
MSTAKVWRDLAREFERVDPTAKLHLVCSRGLTTTRMKLIVNSDFVPLLVRDKFHALAAQAGGELDSESDSPVQVWLTEITRTNRPDVIDPPREFTDPKTGQREYLQIFQLNDLGALSAALCYRLETKARHTFKPKSAGEQRQQLIDAHYNIGLQAEIAAKTEFLKRKHLRELEEQETHSRSTAAFNELITELDKAPVPTDKPHSQLPGNRAALIDAYKRECRNAGIKVTDAMIAKAASSSWNDRTQVTWWKRTDSRSTSAADSAIRRVLRDKPHLKAKEITAIPQKYRKPIH